MASSGRLLLLALALLATGAQARKAASRSRRRELHNSTPINISLLRSGNEAVHALHVERLASGHVADA